MIRHYGEQGLLGLPQHVVPLLLRRYGLNKALPKKIHELLIGYIFVQFVETSQRETSIIGFPAADNWRDFISDDNMTIDFLLENQNKLIKDDDVDLMISSGGLTTRYQISRFVYPSGKNSHYRLSELITKKCRHQQPDANLSLVISLESKRSITEAELQDLLSKVNIPYGNIILISKASSKRGHFTYYMLYPKIFIGKDIQLDLPV